MHPLRVNTVSTGKRRRSSLAIAALHAVSHVKPGRYGHSSSSSHSASPTPAQTSLPSVTFAPNVTPTTFTAGSRSPSPSSFSRSGSPHALFPPSYLPNPTAAKRRQPPGKRRSMGYIPRPPNAFMLFRADFVRQKHVPGSIETNHGSLSKIIGNCWRALPLEEKKIWEIRAKQAKAEHKRLYPDYRFKPVHTKKKAAQAAAAAAALAVNAESSSKALQRKKPTGADAAAEEARCEAVAQLLLEGKKGAELAAAVRAMDAKTRNAHIHVHRRSSSVPPMMYSNSSAGIGGIAMPSLPHLDLHIPVPDPSPASHDVTFISRLRAPATNEPIHVPRRPSSARPFFGQYEGAQAWDMQNQAFYFGQQDFLAQNPFSVTVGGGEDDALPEPDTSLFNPSFLSSSFGTASMGISQPMYAAEALPPHAVDPFTAPNQMAAPSYNPQFSSMDPSMPAPYPQVAQPQPAYNMPMDMSYNGFEANTNAAVQDSGLYDPFGFDQHGSNGATPSSSRLSTPPFTLDGADLAGTSSWSGSPMAPFTEMPSANNNAAYPNQAYVQYEQQHQQVPSSEVHGNIDVVVSPTPVRSDGWVKALDSAVNGLAQPTPAPANEAVPSHAPIATTPMHHNVKFDEAQYNLSMIGDEDGLSFGSYIPGLGLSRMSIDMGFRTRLSLDVAGTATAAEA